MALEAYQIELTLAEKKALASDWFRALRDEICAAFEAVEDLAATLQKPAGRFERKSWDRDSGGGGEMSLMRGQVFEKVGVNISTVFGTFTDDFKNQVRGAETDGSFWASGISVVAHLQNLMCQRLMNTRFICTSQSWFGGGGDLTPLLPDAEAGKEFHYGLKSVCDRHNLDYYQKYKKWCDEYFYLPHRKEPRGAGGVFYDNLDTGDWHADFAFTQDVGRGFCDTYVDIVKSRMNKSWTDEDRHQQLVRRGRYVEFNLLHDRGTLFGLKTDGNIEAILMSLPPEVRWP